MAHFAEIDNNYQVTRVLRVDNIKCVDAEGCECEEVGVEYLRSIYGENTNWVQTSYNSKQRGMYAGKGYLYLPEQDSFVPPSPFPSWTLNRSKRKWEAPIPEPEHDDATQATNWDEDQQCWHVTENEALKALEEFKKQNPELE